MEVNSNNFIALAEVAIQNSQMTQAVRRGTLTAFNGRLNAMFAIGDEHGQALRAQAAEAKRRALRQLPDLLERAEAKLTENGVTVLWAEDAHQARRYVTEIARQHDVHRVVKGKSMATEEIALNDALIAEGLDVVETDLGEYIIQLNHEAPSHIIAPVIHKSKDDIRRIFREKLNMPDYEDARDIVAFARQKLREIFLSADMGITGGNFVIAETGSITLVMNEGNGRMVTTMPRVHVAVVGIEKVIESMEDYSTLVQVLSRSGTGQKLAVYNNIVNGPCHDGGPEQVYVIFLDNGRSRIYAQARYTEALACIRCGACLNACPVYRSVGGHAYGWVYGGPIGAVITPLLTGLDQATPLPYASSLCGSCKAACPVDIDLPRMLLDLRNDVVEARKSGIKWDIAIKGWQIMNTSPRRFALGGRAARLALKTGIDRVIPTPLGAWTKYRDFPDFAPKMFRQLWQERQAGE